MRSFVCGRRLTYKSLAGSLAVVVGAVVFTFVLDGPARSAAVLPADDGLAVDAAAYAERYGVSQAEAERRLELQAEIGDLGARLTEGEPETFGGLSIEHKPVYGVFVRFTAGGEAHLAGYLDGTGLAGLVQVVQVQTPLARLQVAAEESVATAAAAGVPTAVMVDVRTNRVVVEVTNVADLSARLQAQGRSLPTEAKLVEVTKLDAPQTNIYAGVGISSCTTGFAVKNQYGTKGISTAGHCNNTQYRSGVLLPYIDGLYGGSYDVQWHTAPGFTVQPWAKDNYEAGSTPYYRIILGTKSRSEQQTGWWVCKYGAVTGYTCGEIVSKSYTPSVPNAAATYIRIQGDPWLGPCLSAHGDSGGPWYYGGLAVGIHGGGQCFLLEGTNYSYYMAINYLTALDPGVTVLLG